MLEVHERKDEILSENKTQNNEMELCVDNRISRASVDFESFSLCSYAYQKMANMKRRSVRVVKEIDSNTIVLDQLPKGAHVRIMSSSVSF